LNGKATVVEPAVAFSFNQSFRICKE